MRHVRLLLVLSSREVDGDEFIGNVALFGYLGHATRASGYVGTVKLECHERYGGRLPFGCGDIYTIIFACTTTIIHSAYLFTILLVVMFSASVYDRL